MADIGRWVPWECAPAQSVRLIATSGQVKAESYRWLRDSIRLFNSSPHPTGHPPNRRLEAMITLCEV
jgi:hypothetical protein